MIFTTVLIVVTIRPASFRMWSNISELPFVCISHRTTPLYCKAYPMRAFITKANRLHVFGEHPFGISISYFLLRCNLFLCCIYFFIHLFAFSVLLKMTKTYMPPNNC